MFVRTEECLLDPRGMVTAKTEPSADSPALWSIEKRVKKRAIILASSAILRKTAIVELGPAAMVSSLGAQRERRRGSWFPIAAILAAEALAPVQRVVAAGPHRRLAWR
jgi:hypothetical protein